MAGNSRVQRHSHSGLRLKEQETMGVRSVTSIRRVGALYALLAWAQVSAAQGPDPVSLLDDMQRALIPAAAQFTRVQISMHSDQPGGGSSLWDALVVRQRSASGPRSAISMVSPANIKGSAMLTAPKPDSQALGLWLYSPDEQRARTFSPLEADRRFLSTDFSFEDIAMTTRSTKPPVLLGSELHEQRLFWKVEAQPDLDRYYSRMVTWIADDTRLPLKREYYDRGGKLWKVVKYREQRIDDIPTIVAIELRDVQSRDLSLWQVKAVAYAHDKFDARVLSPAGLGALQTQAFWQQLRATSGRSESD